MVDFLIFCMATVGLTAILVDGKIFAPFRERLEHRVHAQEERQQKTIARGRKKRRTWSGFLLEIITCYQCCGFWSGLFCGGFLTASRFNEYLLAFPDTFPYVLLSPVFWLVCGMAAGFLLMCGLAGSFLAVVYRMFVELIFEKTMLYRRTNPEPPSEDFANEESEYAQSEHDV